ncbi:hypothetical protein LTR62_007541 [Meristemomyces frigidus]|uniref:Uncharacterized protein n=1 Tax=Meristemomyces frigidus TaxID=1508187 RepID=A0AAN7YHU5_9PEZI|nr:hypothetical protein LTR62_007541 [Meristemomyces frigidus]
MPPPIPPISIQCSHCRTFTTSARASQLRPENPAYISIPTPPQQNLPYRPFIKGRLPVPRDVFSGAEGRDKTSNDFLDPLTKGPLRARQPQAGSREEWKGKMSEMRRQNLREGLVGLKARKERVGNTIRSRGERNAREREAAVHAAEREDERLTAPSHGLDLEALKAGFEGPGVRVDPGRAARIARTRTNVASANTLAATTRAQHLNHLYTHARSFIINSTQLDAAVDDAFGSAENPVAFGRNFGVPDQGVGSVWAAGLPDRVQDLLNRDLGIGGPKAMDAAGGKVERSRERMDKLVEVMTGGRGGIEEDRQ